MIQLEGLAGITRQSFFIAPESAVVLLSPAVLIAPYCRPSFFLV